MADATPSPGWHRHVSAHRIAGASLFLLSLIHLGPLVGVLGVARVEALYGIDIASPDLEPLLRHRAVLFGMVGAVMLASVWRARWRSLAFGLAFANLASFLALSWQVGDVSAELGRVGIVDAVGLAILSLGVAAHVVARDA
jgi:hypothetical protein